MAILITSPGLVTTGTEGADDIRYQGGVTANGSVVNGLAGADTIQHTHFEGTKGESSCGMLDGLECFFGVVASSPEPICEPLTWKSSAIMTI